MDEGNAPATLPRPGDTIAGKYAIVRVIGEGGMGVVYEAHHLRLRRRVALKMLLPHMMATSSDTVARFEREARAAGQLRDRHVTKVLDVDTTTDGMPYLVMEYLEGHDLEAELNARGPLPIGEAVAYVLQVCSAMAEAHDAGIVHRDLKPSNLFLCPDRDGWMVKILDFGISKMADENDARLTGTQASVGTPLYMSPEQVRSARNVDSRTDIWALGVILYELLAGRTPFEGSTTAAAASIVADPTPPLSNFRDDVPDDLHRAILRALAKDPAERHQTVTELAQALLPHSAPVHPSVTPPPPPSSGSFTPEPPSSQPATSSPFHPSHPSHASRLSYPRAPESSATVGGADPPPRSASPTPAVIPSRSAQAPSRRGVVAVAGAAVLLVAAGLLAAQRKGAALDPNTGASTIGAPVPSPTARAPESAPAPATASAPASAREPEPSSVPAHEPSPVHTPSPRSNASAHTGLSRSTPAPSHAAPAPAPAPAPTQAPARGPANPLFL